MNAYATARIVVRPDPQFAELVPKYISGRRLEVQRLQDAVEKKDARSIFMIGHTMIGSGSPLGFDGLSRLGKAIQEAGRAADFEEARRCASLLNVYLDNVEVRYA